MPEGSAPRVRQGSRLSAKLWNQLCDVIDRARIKTNIGGGLDIRYGPDGTILTVISEEGTLPAQAPAAGIPARVGATPGSAVCTLYTWDGTSFALGTATVTVLNDYTGAVGNNKLIKIYRWAGALWVGPESCT